MIVTNVISLEIDKMKVQGNLDHNKINILNSAYTSLEYLMSIEDGTNFEKVLKIIDNIKNCNK